MAQVRFKPRGGASAGHRVAEAAHDQIKGGFIRDLEPEAVELTWDEYDALVAAFGERQNTPTFRRGDRTLWGVPIEIRG